MKAVAWRWRPRGALSWIYDPSQEWLAEQSSDEIERQALVTEADANAEIERAVRVALTLRRQDIELAITYLGRVYGLLQEGKPDEAGEFCRATAEAWTQDLAEPMDKSVADVLARLKEQT
jgi:hypothetical protein